MSGDRFLGGLIVMVLIAILGAAQGMATEGKSVGQSLRTGGAFLLLVLALATFVALLVAATRLLIFGLWPWQ